MTERVVASLIIGINLITFTMGTERYSIRRLKAGGGGAPYRWDTQLFQPVPSDRLKAITAANPMNSDPNPDATLPERITPEVRELLTPEIFTQSDPILYFLKKTINLPNQQIRTLEFNMRFYLAGTALPARYRPYALALWHLLRCLFDLEDAKLAIENIKQSSYAALPSGLLSSKLSELFSSDVFSDEKPPFQLLVKLMNLSQNDIGNLTIQLQNLCDNDQLPKQYWKYIGRLKYFFIREDELRSLIKSVTEMRNIVAARNQTGV